MFGFAILGNVLASGIASGWTAITMGDLIDGILTLLCVPVIWLVPAGFFIDHYWAQSGFVSTSLVHTLGVAVTYGVLFALAFVGYAVTSNLPDAARYLPVSVLVPVVYMPIGCLVALLVPGSFPRRRLSAK
jgi:hypothetical protein